MSDAACPFCGAALVGPAQRLERCRRCNLFVRRSATSGAIPPLDAESRDFCPWCAYPVAREQSVPERGEFPCPGCAGTLSADILETQVAIDAYRKRRLPGRSYVWFLLILIAIVAAVVIWVLP